MAQPKISPSKTKFLSLLRIFGLLVGAIPYMLGMLVTRPEFTTPEHYHNTVLNFTERGVVFFAFAIVLNLLIWSINHRQKSLKSTLTILFLGMVFLAILAKSKTTYSSIPGAFISILMLLALLPLKHSLKVQANWRLHLACTLFSSFWIAITSLTIFYAESPFFTPVVNIMMGAPLLALYALLDSVAPILLSIAAGSFGAVYGLLGMQIFENKVVVKPELNGTPKNAVVSEIPTWYTNIVIILITVPPITLGLMAVEGFLPPMFRLAYAGIAGAILLQSRCRVGQTPQKSFSKGAYITILLLVAFFIFLGALPA